MRALVCNPKSSLQEFTSRFCNRQRNRVPVTFRVADRSRLCHQSFQRSALLRYAHRLHGKSRGRQEAAVHSLPLLQRAGSFAILSCGNPFQSTVHPATRHASNGRRFRQPCICAVTKLCCGASKQGLAACEPSVQQLQLRTHCASAHGHGFLQPKLAGAGDGRRAEPDCCLHLQHPEPG